MFNRIDLSEYVIKEHDNGWMSLNMQYFADHPEEVRMAQRALRHCNEARETLRRRYRKLNNDSRPLGQCPKKGIAVKQRSTEWYVKWLNHLMEVYHKHYGDLSELEDCPNSSADDVDRFVSGKHEHFQARKMGMYAPYGKDSLTHSVGEFISVAQENNRDHMRLEETDLMIHAFDEILEEDLAGIPRNSIRCVSPSEAIYGSNVQGLATGMFQQSRDNLLSSRSAVDLSKWYDYKFNCNVTVADNLINFYRDKVIDFAIHHNVVSNLKRIQVGGVDFNPSDPRDKITAKSFRKAKYRTINANDPVVQVAEASAAIAFRNALLQYTDCAFYNTLLDPDQRWHNMKRMQLEAEKCNATMFPFDFELHDARLHAEWMFNLMQRVVKPLFHDDDKHVVDLVSIALCFKIIMSPKAHGGINLIGLIGALGSGDPWTNIIGTLGTRAIGRLLHLAAPDVFLCNRLLGCNNGDDASYAISKTALQEMGIDDIIQLANSIVTKYCYKFNESKFLLIPVAGSGFTNHWEQYAYWYNPLSGQVMRHGSTLRYAGKVYSDEDLGRQDAHEGLIDQLSTLNNTLAYVGDQTFTTTTFNVEIIRDFVLNDPILKNYIVQHGQAFFDHLVEDAVQSQVKRLRNNPNNMGLKDAELVTRAESKIVHHLRAAGFDRNGLTQVVHDRDFSFLGIIKLMGLGPEELTRISGCGLGMNLTFRITNGNVEWLRGNVA